MKRCPIKTVTVFILIILLSCSSIHSNEKKDPSGNKHGSPTLRIASFNMQIFGKTKLGRPNTLSVLAKIASNFDIIALQEVGSNKSSASVETCRSIMDAYISRINEVADKNVYSYVQGNQYAFVFRTDRVRLNRYSIYSGSQNFSFTPLTANFKTAVDGANFDFSMIAIHTSPGKAGDEIPALKTAIDEIRDLYSEPDVLCAGDYNADGSYYDEGSEEWLSGFDNEYYITGIGNSADTTVAASDNTYDRIQMTKSVSSDYSGNSGVFRFDEIYDITECEGGRTTAGTAKAISDHYPAWCEYYTDRDSD